MDVVVVANVAGDHHARVGDFQRRGLCLPKLRQHGWALVAIREGRNLHVIERQLATPELTPALDERLHLLGVELAFDVVGFALIPDRAADAERHERMNHRIVERRGLPLRVGARTRGT